MKNPTIVKTLNWPDEATTQASAQHLAGRISDVPSLNACITLTGDLGAGKTTWVRHLLQALGVQGRVKSPTYAVVESYTVALGDIWHFDFYRFNDPQEWEDAGFRDIFASAGLKLCEWPQNVQGIMPAPDLALHIVMNGTDRHVSLTAFTPVGEALLA